MEPPAADLTEAPSPRLQAGGALREGSLYVERAADAELDESLERGELSTVIAPFQMGKSSLRRRTERRLARRGACCLSVDLGLIGSTGVTEDAWFHALGFLLADRAGIALDPLELTRAGDGLPPADRFARFLTESLFPRADAPLAVFLDEIDVALDLPFSSGRFFAALIAAHEASGRAPSSLPVPFCLFGTTPPERWGSDPLGSPFAVDRVIKLAAFTREEAAALLPGLRAAGGDAVALLDAILEETKGHPYRTQRLCELLTQATAADDAHPRAAERDDAHPKARVARLVRDDFL